MNFVHQPKANRVFHPKKNAEDFDFGVVILLKNFYQRKCAKALFACAIL